MSTSLFKIWVTTLVVCHLINIKDIISYDNSALKRWLHLIKAWIPHSPGEQAAAKNYSATIISNVGVFKAETQQ